MGYLDDLWNTKYFNPYEFTPEAYSPVYNSGFTAPGAEFANPQTLYGYAPTSAVSPTGGFLTGYKTEIMENPFYGGVGGKSESDLYSLLGKTVYDPTGSPIGGTMSPSEYKMLSDMFRLGLLKQPTTTATVPTETPTDYGVGTTEGGTDLEIPEGLYPYAFKGAYQGVSPQNQGLMQLPFAEALAGLQEYLRPGGAEKLFGETRQGLLAGFRPAYEGQITESLAPLAEKGLLGGTTQENILKGVTAELSKSYDIEALNRTEEKVKNFLNSIGGLGELLKYSSEYAEEANPLAPYELWSKLASSWLGNV